MITEIGPCQSKWGVYLLILLIRNSESLLEVFYNIFESKGNSKSKSKSLIIVVIFWVNSMQQLQRTMVLMTLRNVFSLLESFFVRSIVSIISQLYL